MAITQYEFWYDRQMVRMLEQVVRAFSGFSYQNPGVTGQAASLTMVPARMASTSRMVANLMSNQTENTALNVPLITVYQTGLRGRREDLQNPTHVDQRQVFEREIKPDGSYGHNLGNTFSVDRIMPLPFLMEVSVDIWTSNLQQKYMLVEQILPVIYPQFQIQNSDNALDWTAITICVVDDDFSFSSRTVPAGGTDEIDIMSIHLRIPIWLSPPAKVKSLRRIEEIIANVSEGELDQATGLLDTGTQFSQVVVTPDDACIEVSGQTITLLGKNASTPPPESWLKLVTKYGGVLQPTVSKLKLFIDNDINGRYVTGSLRYTANTNHLTWIADADTLPADDMHDLNAVIDPWRSFPGKDLPTPVQAQRYLIINDIVPCDAWGNCTASANDIIQYVNGAWVVSFDSKSSSNTLYVLNTFTGRQLRWTGSHWVMAIDGVYEPGHWRIALTPNNGVI